MTIQSKSIHREGSSRGIASNHSDPEHLWLGLGMGYTMDGFRKEVAVAMKDNIPQPTEWSICPPIMIFFFVV